MAIIQPRRDSVSMRSARSIGAIILHEMSATYGRTPGGYLWAILEPLGFIVVMAVGFGLVFHAPPLGTNFMLFYATGFLPLHIYSELAGKLMNALRYFRPLIAYPAVLWIDTMIARTILHWGTGIVVSTIVVGTILLFDPLPIWVDPASIFIGLTMVALIGIGVGTINCYLTGRFAFWSRIWAIAARPIFFGSGVFYTFENLAEPLQSWLWWNPIIHAVSIFRSGFYQSYHPDFISYFYGFGTGLVMLVIGLMLLRKSHDRIN